MEDSAFRDAVLKRPSRHTIHHIAEEAFDTSDGFPVLVEPKNRPITAHSFHVLTDPVDLLVPACVEPLCLAEPIPFPHAKLPPSTPPAEVPSINLAVPLYGM